MDTSLAVCPALAGRVRLAVQRTLRAAGTQPYVWLASGVLLAGLAAGFVWFRGTAPAPVAPNPPATPWELATAHKPRVVPQENPPRTDRGRAVAAWAAPEPRPPEVVSNLEAAVFGPTGVPEGAVRRGPADDRSNCHGWVFAGGRLWMDESGVAAALMDNGYQRVSDPRPGDLALFIERDRVRHSAVVSEAFPGRSVRVVGKFGWMGVFEHAADQCFYSGEPHYFRSPRAGHLLGNLDPVPASPASRVAAH